MAMSLPNVPLVNFLGGHFHMLIFYVPALGFSFSTQHIWKVIRENKYLDFPAHKVIFANVH
jgi:hypothetical protein